MFKRMEDSLVRSSIVATNAPEKAYFVDHRMLLLLLLLLLLSLLLLAILLYIILQLVFGPRTRGHPCVGQRAFRGLE